MAEGRCAHCLLYEKLRGDRIRAEIAKTSPRRRDRIARWARFMEAVHDRHLAVLAARTLGRFENATVDQPADPAPACPQCGGELYLCEAQHTDEPGPRWHCRAAAGHNYMPAQISA